MSKKKKAKPADDPVVVRLELPIPMDIAGTLIKIIGLTWPNTMIADGDGEHGWRSERRLTLHIDQRDRHRSAKKRAKYEKVKQYASGWVGSLTELGPGGVAVSPHEMLTKLWVDLAKRSFDMFPDAPNYLESVARDADNGDRYVFWVARSEKQTPHELRQKAEDRVKELEAELEKLTKGQA